MLRGQFECRRVVLSVPAVAGGVEWLAADDFARVQSDRGSTCGAKPTENEKINGLSSCVVNSRARFCRCIFV